MLTCGGITLYHMGYDKRTRMETYQRRYFAQASIQEDIAANVGSGGLQAANVVKVRIPVPAADGPFDGSQALAGSLASAENQALADGFIAVKEGDRAVLGRCDLPEPPEGAYTVLHTADNRKGSRGMWHYKLVLA